MYRMDKQVQCTITLKRIRATVRLYICLINSDICYLVTTNVFNLLNIFQYCYAFVIYIHTQCEIIINKKKK